MTPQTVTVLEAPALAGSRCRAKLVVLDLPADLSGAEVVLNCRHLLAAAVSFADQLVKEILVTRRAHRLRVVEASETEFLDQLRGRAAAHGVADRLDTGGQS